ncbi:MAG: PAS domain-containing protein, partial [Pseudomonadota bacterium]
DRRLFASAIYNDYLKPHANDLGRVLSCITENGVGFFGAVTANRAIPDEEFDEIERRVMRFLAPHFATSISVQLHLSKLENRLQATEAALDGLPVGVCLLDGTGAIAHCNRAARDILGANDGLTERAGQLRAAAARSRRELNARIEQVVATGLGRAGSPGAMLSIRRPSRRRPYSVLIAPLDTARDTTNGIIGRMRPCAIALISDLERESQYPADFLARRYGLTASQAQLALEIAAGASVPDAADRLAMTVETARQQLKLIYAKTEVRRQAELARLLTADLAAQASRLLGS